MLPSKIVIQLKLTKISLKLIYNMLKLPTELYTPLFAVARIAGWSAHRIEELINGNKIIRPAYMAIADHREYKPLEER